MAKIILVHGSWHWAGCFHKIIGPLAEAGHEVLALDNASHGVDATDWRDVASMEDYNARMIAEIEASEGKVVLVGHSMGGVTLTHLADRMPERIEKLIYLTGFMTRPGRTANDQIMAYAADPVCAPLFAVLAPEDNWKGIRLVTEDSAMVKETFYGDCSDEDVAYSMAHATIVNTSVPNLYDPQSAAEIERHYILCSKDRAIPLASQQEMVAQFPGTIVHQLETSHSPFYSQPAELVRILRGAV